MKLDAVINHEVIKSITDSDETQGWKYATDEAGDLKVRVDGERLLGVRGEQARSATSI